MIGLEIWLWVCVVKYVSVEKMFFLYGIIVFLINFIGGGGFVKKLNVELCFVKESIIIYSEIIVCLF